MLSCVSVRSILGRGFWQEVQRGFSVSASKIRLIPVLDADLAPVARQDARGDGRWMSLHKRYRREADDSKGCCDILFIGDSVIYGMQFSSIYKQMVECGIRALNFGLSSDKVENVTWRVQDGDWVKQLNPKVIVLMVGTGNTEVPAIHVARAIEKVTHELETKGDAPVLLPKLLPRGEYPNPCRKQIEAVNALLQTRYGNSSLEASRVVELCRNDLLDGDGRMNRDLMHDYANLTDRGYSQIFPPLFLEIYKWYSKQKKPSSKLPLQ